MVGGHQVCVDRRAGPLACRRGTPRGGHRHPAGEEFVCVGVAQVVEPCTRQEDFLPGSVSPNMTEVVHSDRALRLRGGGGPSCLVLICSRWAAKARRPASAKGTVRNERAVLGGPKLVALPLSTCEELAVHLQTAGTRVDPVDAEACGLALAKPAQHAEVHGCAKHGGAPARSRATSSAVNGTTGTRTTVGRLAPRTGFFATSTVGDCRLEHGREVLEADSCRAGGQVQTGGPRLHITSAHASNGAVPEDREACTSKLIRHRPAVEGRQADELTRPCSTPRPWCGSWRVNVASRVIRSC